MSLVVLGSVNADLVIRGPKLPRPGETVLGGEFFRAAGGKGANQAVAAARAGRDTVIFLAAVGDDPFGRQSLAGLAAEGIDCQWIRTVGGSATGVALILVDPQGENLISVASGANLALTPDWVDGVPDEVFAPAKVFLASLESPAAAVERGLSRARRASVRTVLNPAPALSPEVAEPQWRLADVLTPNEHEAAMLSGMPVDSVESAVAAARQLQARRAGDLIVTLGSQGCVVVEKNVPPVVVPPLPVQAIDATAAGDAFSGALAVALSEGKSLVDAARFATAAAGIAVTRAGAQPSLARREEIEAALSQRTTSCRE
ncbi:MAG TPA: ribokinase [Pirellulaceae bacterium]|nr:ribokinase [Pirellulaceae bacterium]